ncbi:hypothetical protein [Streptomyces sp. RP5T]|uniref:hypothetical protein n=1 Tax=Streptomyces sp. RP5T TaxID=2490848 RepID=UPI000F648649|nr:hypothetical protein [Streptomyces sp. RP5T]RRR84852.1 hypothetical protein EHS43_10365 [Streptomyces sp. RP5T]
MRYRNGGALTAVVLAIAISACGNSDSGDGESNSPPAASSQPTEEFTSQYSQEPSSAPGGDWGEQAEAVCSDQYSSAGSPEQVGDPASDAQMAADSAWAANLQNATAQALTNLGNPPPEVQSLIADLQNQALVNADLMKLYDQGTLGGAAWQNDQNAIQQIQQHVAGLEASLGTKSCTEIASKYAPA